MPTRTRDKRVELSFSNWVLGGSLLSVPQQQKGLRKSSHSRKVVVVEGDGEALKAKTECKKKIVEPEKGSAKEEDVKCAKRRCKTCLKERTTDDEGEKTKEVCTKKDQPKTEDTKKEECTKVGAESKKNEPAKEDKEESKKEDSKKADPEAKKDEPSKTDSKEKDTATKEDNPEKDNSKKKDDVKWTTLQDSKLMGMKKGNKPWKEIAAQVGHAEKDCKARFKELEPNYTTPKNSPKKCEAKKVEDKKAEEKKDENVGPISAGTDWGVSATDTSAAEALWGLSEEKSGGDSWDATATTNGNSEDNTWGGTTAWNISANSGGGNWENTSDNVGNTDISAAEAAWGDTSIFNEDSGNDATWGSKKVTTTIEPTATKADWELHAGKESTYTAVNNTGEANAEVEPFADLFTTPSFVKPGARTEESKKNGNGRDKEKQKSLKAQKVSSDWNKNSGEMNYWTTKTGTETNDWNTSSGNGRAKKKYFISNLTNPSSPITPFNPNPNPASPKSAPSHPQNSNWRIDSTTHFGGGYDREKAHGRLRVTSVWTRKDCEVLEMLEARHTEHKWMHMQAEFYNWTGRMVCADVLRGKFEEDGVL